MNELKLPQHVSREEVDKAIADFQKVKVFELRDEDGNHIKDVVVHRPNAYTMEQYYKLLDKQPYKANKLLIKNTFIGEDANEFSNKPFNSDEFIAAMSAAIEMLPSGKASVKN